MARRILSVIVAAAAAFLVIMALEGLSHRVYPPPPGLDLRDPSVLRGYAKALPAGALLLVLLGYALGSLVGGGVATLVAGRTTRWPGLVVGALLMTAGLANLLMIPHPAWFAVASTLVYLPLAWLGSRAVLRGGGGAL